jgi:hypothetical protein
VCVDGFCFLKRLRQRASHTSGERFQQWCALQCTQPVKRGDKIILLSRIQSKTNRAVVERRAIPAPARASIITVVVVHKNFVRNVESSSNGIASVWPLNDISFPAVFSSETKANFLQLSDSWLEYAKQRVKSKFHFVNTEIGAPAIDLVVLTHDLVTVL